LVQDTQATPTRADADGGAAFTNIDPAQYPPQGVNPHYLEHLVASAELQQVQASEDIFSGTGLKLLAKGAHVDERIRERLLQHKLQKPLEDCITLGDAVTPHELAEAAAELLSQHALLRELCTDRGAAEALGSLTLSAPLRSLLTLYVQQAPFRLAHAVGVALLAQSFGRRFASDGDERQHVLGIAGLLHDVGELYIDPVHLRRGTQLDSTAWRHIVVHPLVGDRVLRHVSGGSSAIADAVLHHHERLDGFGYPHGTRGNFSVAGQIVAAAEWLMGLLDSGVTPRIRAHVACRLIPGEFNRAVIDALAQASQTNRAEESGDNEGPLASCAPALVRIAATLRHLDESTPWIEERMSSASPGLRFVVRLGIERLQRIRVALASTGLDAGDPVVLLADLEAMHDPKLHLEVVTVVHELEWRLREFDREAQLRAGMLAADEQLVVEELMGRLNGAVVPEQVPPP
jgi:hypothetical protein